MTHDYKYAHMSEDDRNALTPPVRTRHVTRLVMDEADALRMIQSLLEAGSAVVESINRCIVEGSVDRGSKLDLNVDKLRQAIADAKGASK